MVGCEEVGPTLSLSSQMPNLRADDRVVLPGSRGPARASTAFPRPVTLLQGGKGRPLLLWPRLQEGR